MSRLVAKILADVEAGESLSNSLSKHPNAFSPTYVALVKSGEVGGVLDNVLNRLADDLEKQQEFAGRVRTALIYPAIVIGGMIVVAVIMLVFVIPRLTALYSEFDAQLPFVTRALIGTSSFVTKFWPLILLVLGGSGYGLFAFSKTEEGKRRLDSLIFKIPLIGPLYRQIKLTEITRTLSLMIGSGVSILEGLTIAADVVGNVIIADALNDSADMVEKGFPVAYSFSKHPTVFPFILSQMVAVGEETGKTNEVLGKVSHIFEIESDQKLKALLSAIEPIILIVLGVAVAFLVISILLPIYNLTSQI